MMKPEGQLCDLRVCGGQGRGRTADLPIFSWRPARLVRQGQDTSGLSRARQGRARCDPGQITTNHDVCVRDQSVPKTRLGDPFRNDSLSKPFRLLEKYKDYVCPSAHP